MTQYVVEKQRLPRSNAEVGLKDPLSGPGVQRVQVDEQGRIVMTLSGTHPALIGKTVIFEPYIEDSRLYWNCAAG